MGHSRRVLNRYLQLPLLLWAAVCLSSCADGLLLPAPSFGDGSISGRVIEEGTGRPIDGAIVAVYWDGVIPIAGSQACFHMETAVSGPDGAFHTAAWSFPHAVYYTEHDMRYEVYKEGFSFHQRSFLGATLELIPFAGSRDDWLRELLRLSTQYCSGYPSSGFAAMKQAIGDEVEKLIRTPEERRRYLDPIRESTKTELRAASDYQRWLQDRRESR